MMNKKIEILFSLMLLAIASSCSLKEDMKSSSTPEDYYTSIEKCRTGVNACYDYVRSIYSGSGFWLTTECTTDLMIQNLSTSYNAILDISPVKPGYGSYLWSWCYSGVMTSNLVIHFLDKGIKENTFPQDEALKLKGEAVILRSLFYYLLTSSFGDVPYYTERVTQDNMRRIASLPRMSARDTRDSLVVDLRKYVFPESLGGEGVLPMTRTYTGTTDNSMGLAVGLMIGAKCCMWNERWDDAIEILECLEDIYGHYSSNPAQFAKDYPLSDVRFSQKYTRESILELSNVYEEHGMQTTGDIARFAIPSKGSKTVEEGDETYVISDIYSGIAIPELGSNALTSVPVLPTSYVYTNLLSYYSKDKRAGDYSNGSDVSREGSGNIAWRWSGYASDDVMRDPSNRSVRWFSSCPRPIDRPWLGNKFWCFGMNSSKDSNNYKIFRFADALLMLAEAHLNRGDMDKACEYLNITRYRAGFVEPQDIITPAYVGWEEINLMEEIRMERAKELFGEYQRKFDLVRWGIWYERTLQYNDGMYLSGNIRPCHRYLPIPQDQVTYSGGALTNDEYEK